MKTMPQFSLLFRETVFKDKGIRFRESESKADSKLV